MAAELGAAEFSGSPADLAKAHTDEPDAGQAGEVGGHQGGLRQRPIFYSSRNTTAPKCDFCVQSQSDPFTRPVRLLYGKRRPAERGMAYPARHPRLRSAPNGRGIARGPGGGQTVFTSAACDQQSLSLSQSNSIRGPLALNAAACCPPRRGRVGRGLWQVVDRGTLPVAAPAE